MIRTVSAARLFVRPDPSRAGRLAVQPSPTMSVPSVGPLEQSQSGKLANNATFGLVVSPGAGADWIRAIVGGPRMLARGHRSGTDQPVAPCH